MKETNEVKQIRLLAEKIASNTSPKDGDLQAIFKEIRLEIEAGGNKLSDLAEDYLKVVDAATKALDGTCKEAKGFYATVDRKVFYKRFLKEWIDECRSELLDCAINGGGGDVTRSTEYFKQLGSENLETIMYFMDFGTDHRLLGRYLYDLYIDQIKVDLTSDLRGLGELRELLVTMPA